MTETKRRNDKNAAALYQTLKESAALDDLDEIAAMSDEELDSHIRDEGGDPTALRESGRALVEAEQERRARLPWHSTMERKIQELQGVAKSASERRARLPRAELLARIDLARRDPRFRAPVSALFQKKTLDASTDEELEQLLLQIELLAKVEGPA